MALLELGELGQAGGLVDGVADHGVLEARQRADVAGNGPARGHPDAELGGAQHRHQFVVQLARRGQRRARGVRVFDGGAEDGQRRVTLELVDEAAVPVHGVHDDPEELVEDRHHLGGGPRRRQLRRPDQVDEQHRDVAFLAAQLGAALQGAARDVLADVAAEQVAQPLPFGQVAHHVVEPGLQQAQLAGVVDLHVRVVVTALHLAQGPPQLAQRVGDGHGDQDVAGQADGQRGDRQQQDGGVELVVLGDEGRVLTGQPGHDDRQQRHTRRQHPGQHLALDDAGGPEVLGHTVAQRGDRDGPQHALRLQVTDDRGGGGAERAGHGDERRRAAGHRPAGDDEDHRAEEPVPDADQRPVVRHLEGPGAGQLGERGVVCVAVQGVAPLPADHGDQQPQTQPRRHDERDEQDGQEHCQIHRRQVLQLDAVFGRQTEPQEAQNEQCADDVGLQQAQREHRPRRARHPSDEPPDSPDVLYIGGHPLTVSGRGDGYCRCAQVRVARDGYCGAR